jgi:lysophospholipase L1-like esterase
MTYETTRRNFIRTAAAGSIAAIGLPAIVNEAFAAEMPKKLSLQKNDIILFQGDSITDAGRKKDTTEANSLGHLGHGYALFATADMLRENPDKNLTVYNKGISGNKAYQLLDRWDTDCIALKPTVVSIMVGVNDFWHTLVNGYKGTLDTYKTDYRKLLDKTQKELPGVRLIIGEPFALIDVKAVTKEWYPAFDGYRQAARDIAAEYSAALIPYQTVFDIKEAPGSYWTGDGVHPSIAGASLMSHAWLKAAGQ